MKQGTERKETVMKSRVTIGVAVLMIGATLAMPSTSEAGGRAKQQKQPNNKQQKQVQPVMRGLAVAHILMNAMQAATVQNSRRATVKPRSQRQTRQEPVRAVHHVETRQGRNSRQHGHGYNNCNCCNSGPVVIYKSETKRIVQQRIHGATAYVQIWSSYEGRWVTVQEHSSIY